MVPIIIFVPKKRLALLTHITMIDRVAAIRRCTTRHRLIITKHCAHNTEHSVSLTANSGVIWSDMHDKGFRRSPCLSGAKHENHCLILFAGEPPYRPRLRIVFGELQAKISQSINKTRCPCKNIATPATSSIFITDDRGAFCVIENWFGGEEHGNVFLWY